MNMQPGASATPTQVAACAVHCCDKKKYVLKKSGRKVEQNCSRLGTKKHSCVTHALREHKNGRMTTSTKKGFGDIVVPKAASIVTLADGSTYNAKPDIIVNGNVSIDAKFPCDVEGVKAKNKGIKFGEAAFYPSEKAGRTMMGFKEEDVYIRMEGIDDSRTMTPEMAEDEKHEDCKCN
jgi:hypothetical protein